ncbi:MAG: hypothetical protein D4R65_10900 [Verrucomicrobiaceae bacterium]|nr:MAG: hypothetical protein D4R65_10900 [Verrucomicrobiaceae bacterium]
MNPVGIIILSLLAACTLRADDTTIIEEHFFIDGKERKMGRSLDGLPIGSTETGIEPSPLNWSVAGAGGMGGISLAICGKDSTGPGIALVKDFPSPQNVVLGAEIPDLDRYSSLTLDVNASVFDTESMRFGFSSKPPAGFDEDPGNAVFLEATLKEVSLVVIQDEKKTVLETVPWTAPKGVVNSTYRLTYDAASGKAGVTVNEDLGKGAVAIAPMPLRFPCALQSLQFEAVNAGILHGNFPRIAIVKLSGTLKP